ncbi:hypothetical protein [Alkalibacillus aidingensis]|uniref:hypothetical protein n=1 Tax=Alkalibacillus aidingensis TaxID=2747607 RepID=UPI0016610E84|nr:hypothetical protein [Alkalibacillus aidingensis]
MEIFNLIIHGITFIVIFWLYQKLKQSTESERVFEKRVNEIEDLFSSYLLEIKDENKKLIQELANFETKNESSPTPKSNSEVNEKVVSENVSPNSQTPTETNRLSEHPKKDKSANEYDPVSLLNQEKKKTTSYAGVEDTEADYDPSKMQIEDHVDHLTPQSHVLHLYKTGHTIEQIAQTLDMGYTEVELIVKFNHKLTN